MGFKRHFRGFWFTSLRTIRVTGWWPVTATPDSMDHRADDRGVELLASLNLAISEMGLGPPVDSWVNMTLS